jgi:thiol-disulfide isomerase/thioredoxin
MKTLHLPLACFIICFTLQLHSVSAQKTILKLKFENKVILDGLPRRTTPTLTVKGFKDYKGIPANNDSLRLGIFVLDREQYWYDQLRKNDSFHSYYSEQIRNYKIDTLQLSFQPLKSYLGILVGVKNGKKTIKVDANNNHDFKDDFEYVFDLVYDNKAFDKNKLENNPIINASYEYFNKGKIEIGEYSFRLKPFDQGYSYKNQLDGLLSTYAETCFYQIATLEKDKQILGITIFDKMGSDNSLKRSEFVFKNYSESDSPYKMIYADSKIRVENTVYEVIAVSNDSVILSLENTNAKNIGWQVGDYVSTEVLKKTNSNNNWGKKYNIVTFWGSWSEPSLNVMPELRKFRNEYLWSVTFTNIACENDEKGIFQAHKIVKEKGLWGHQEYELLKGDNTLNQTLNVQNFPCILILDNAGKILEREVGILGFEEIRKTISSNKYLVEKIPRF